MGEKYSNNYSKWDNWAKEISDDEGENEKRFSHDLARAAYEAKQGKPLNHTTNGDSEKFQKKKIVLEVPEQFAKKGETKE